MPAVSFSIDCTDPDSVRIIDPSGQQHKFPFYLPGISAVETQQAIRDARHWKTVHKLAEQMFKTTLDLRDTCIAIAVCHRQRPLKKSGAI